MVFRTVGPDRAFPDLSQPVTGNEGRDLRQSQGKIVTRPGAEATIADIDIRNHDLRDSDFETGIIDIGGTSGIGIAVESEDNATFEVNIELYNDEDELLQTIDTAEFSVLEDFRVTSTIPVFSDRVNIVITDTSGDPENVINGSINANNGIPSIITAFIESGTVTLESSAVEVQGEDSVGISEEQLDSAIADTSVGLVTYLARALNSRSLDEFVTRVTDSSGTQIDPVTQDVTQGVANDELRSRVHDSAGTQIDPAEQESYDSTYTSVDLNTTGATTLYDPVDGAQLGAVHIANGGGTAELRLEVTDGTNTAVLADAGAGSPIHFTDDMYLGAGDSVQIVVEAAEGSALTETAVASHAEL